MKKFRRLLALLLVMMMLLSACFWKMTEERILLKVSNYYKDAKTISTNVELSEDLFKFDDPVAKSLLGSLKNFQFALDTQTKKATVDTYIAGTAKKLYLDFEDTSSIDLYTDLLGVWMKTTIDKVKNQSKLEQALPLLGQLVKNDEIFKVEKQDGHYELTTTAEKLMKATYKLEETEPEKDQKYPSHIIAIRVDQKDFYVTEIRVKDNPDADKPIVKAGPFAKVEKSIQIPEESKGAIELPLQIDGINK